MSSLQALVKMAKDAQVDRVILTIQPQQDGETTAVASFAIDQLASMSIDDQTAKLRNALSNPIIAKGNEFQIEHALIESIDAVSASLKYAVEQYREQSNAKDIIKAFQICETTTKAADGETNTVGESNHVEAKLEPNTAPPATIPSGSIFDEEDED